MNNNVNACSLFVLQIFLIYTATILTNEIKRYKMHLRIIKRLQHINFKPAKRIEIAVTEGNVFADFTALANQHRAMNLGQGFPSFGN